MGRAQAGRDPFALLISDHRKILALLEEMIAAESGSAGQRIRLFLLFKRKLGKHALAEEDVVYPVLHDISQQQNESKHLYEEHADMKILLYELEGKLTTGTDWSRTVTSLRDLIRAHINEEEQTIFPKLREELGETRLPKVAGQISREEALIL